jgi:hypothetical protein
MRELGVLKNKNFRRSTSERKKNQNWRHCRKAGCKADLNQKGKEKGTYMRSENKPKMLNCARREQFLWNGILSAKGLIKKEKFGEST